jgi:hypothetical protein
VPQQTSKGQAAQQQTWTKYIYKEEGKNTTRTSKVSNLLNHPLIEWAQRRKPSDLRF